MTMASTDSAGQDSDISERARDYRNLDSLVSADELALRGRVRDRGFVVPTATLGFTATPIEPKLVHAGLHPMRHHPASTCDCPPRPCCPTVVGLQGPFACLNEARYGIIWGAMGAARDSYETALRVQPATPAVRAAAGRSTS